MYELMIAYILKKKKKKKKKENLDLGLQKKKKSWILSSNKNVKYS